MPEFKTKFSAQISCEIWVEADDEAHAEELVKANDPSTYSKIRSVVSIGSGSIVIETPTINIISVEEVL